MFSISHEIQDCFQIVNILLKMMMAFGGKNNWVITLLILLLIGWLIDHQFEVNGSYSVGSVVPNIFGPSFALDVDDYSA